MNNPVALLVLFTVIVGVWAVFIALVLVFFKGVQRGRDEYESRMATLPLESDSYSYHAAR